MIQVAVKSFRFHFKLGETESDTYENSSVGVQKRIRRELGIWRNLEHPNIVPFLGIAYGFGGQGHASLVSLWMANGSLQRFLGQHDDRLTNAHRLQLVRDRSVLRTRSFLTPLGILQLLDIANGLYYRMLWVISTDAYRMIIHHRA
ncbi:hypothetical protein JVT61DRAFT_11828 [Boletus reticuloceps]|uniref:Protein kinase domain-containing protein n=1 Tax=Boletus reticuloceps TaxID=495285 RepID=A0A8I2YWA0_9AGAM|nr:hypothetical protein JVT61DRAFT_11828 [Boletus reticuloceps]